MPFIVPFIPAIAAAAGGIASGVGAIKQGNAASKIANVDKALGQQELSQRDQEFTNMIKLFGQLDPFYAKYMSSGSPILTDVQRGSREELSREYAGRRGQALGQVRAMGYGFTPSGTAAGLLGDLSRSEATDASQNFLTNLLANESVKFQAANARQGEMATLRPGGPGYPPNPPISNAGAGYANLASGLADFFKNLPKSTTTTSAPSAPGSSTSSAFTPPSTFGYSGSDWGGA